MNFARRRFLTVLLAAVTVVAWSPGRATAESGLVDSSPRSGSILTEAPTEIVLIDPDRIESRLSRVVVRDEQGHRIATDPPVSTPDPHQFVVPISTPDDLGAGVYVVDYRLVSIDSHVTVGVLTFQIGTATASQSVVSRRVGTLGSGASGWAAGLEGVTYWLALVALSVMLAMWWLLARARSTDGTDDDGRLRRTVWVAWTVLVGATIVGFGAHGVRAVGSGWSGFVQPSLWSDTAATRSGTASIIRLVLMALAVLPVLGIGRPLVRAWRWTVAALAVCLVGTFVATGHAAVGRRPLVGVVVEAVHLGAAAVWIGGLVVVLVGDTSTIGRPAGSSERRRRIVELSLPCLAVLVVTGVLQSWRIGRHPSVVNDTAWGRALVAKAALVLLIGVVVLVTRSTLRRGVEGSARRILTAQAVLGLGAVAIGSLLVALPPRPGRSTHPVTVTSTVGDLTAAITVTPAVVGSDDVHVIISQTGAVEPVAAARLSLSLPERNIAPQDVALTPDGPDHYSAFAVQIPYVGIWTADLVVTTAGGREVTVSVELAIQP
jgi:copper transport protein